MTAFKSVFVLVLGTLVLARAPANVAQESAPTSSRHPVCKDGANQGYYPASAILGDKEGRVVVEYSVDGQGRARDVKILSEEPRGPFGKAAKTFIGNLTCELPPGWNEKENSAKRYRLNMIFEFKPGGKLKPLSPKDPVYTVQAAKSPRG